MELNKKYFVNIISQQKTGSFLVVPKTNEVTSKQCLNYRKTLLAFKECGETNEWFEELDYPHIEIGKVVLVKVNNLTNEWARGIVSKCTSNNLFPEIYLIDSQIFIDRKKRYELRICPSKYLRLRLPTFSICVDLCFNMNDAGLKNAIEMMIHKNQYGELNIMFTPQSMQNNEYIGSLTINDLPLNRYLQILLKKYSTNKEHKSSLFNPLHFYHLKNIFIPKNSNLVLLNENMVSSISDLSFVDDSLENSSSNFLTDTLDDSEDFSDTSSLKTIESSKNSCIIPISKQKVCSSKSSSLSRSNSSVCSLDNEDNSPECLSGNKPTNFTGQNDKKYQVLINPETFSDDKDVLDNSIDYSEDLSDDSSFKTIESSKNSCITPISKQKVCSSKSPSLSSSNSSTCSLGNKDNSPKCLSVNKPTNFTRKNIKKNQALIIFSDDKDVLDDSIDYFEDFSDDSSFKTIESSKNSCITPISKQKVCSSKSPSLSSSNSSTCSLGNKDNSPECLFGNKPTNFTRQNDEKYQVLMNPETFSDVKDVLNDSIDYSEDFSDDSSLKTIESSKNSCITPISKQKVCSSESPSLSRSNSSTCSLDNEDNSPECLSGNKPINFMKQNDEMHQMSINPETTDDNKDASKLNVENTSTEIGYQDINKDKPFIYSLMKKRSRAFRKEAAKCQQNSNVSKISNVSEKPKISLSDDSNLWWSSDDES